MSRFYAQRPAWHGCTVKDYAEDGGADTADLSGLQCTTVTVPLDYAHPAGRTLAIAVARTHATGAARIGSLLLDPGGPGGSGLSYLTSARSSIPAEVRARFDLVGFDPRGVGASAPVRCVTDAQLDAYVALPPDPRTSAEVATVVAAQHGFDAGCAQRSGWELPYVGTAYAARDMDVLRGVLGDRELTYLGKSYGTLLGATYAEEYPQHVRALVLDGAVDPTVPGIEQAHQQALGFQVDLDDFLADCARRSNCPVGHSADAARAGLMRLLQHITARPLPAPGAAHGPLHAGEATYGIATALYSQSFWPFLRQALGKAENGDGSGLMQLSDSYAERAANGHHQNLLEAFTAVGCADGGTSPDLATVRRLAREWASDAPLLGPPAAWGLLSCAAWPVHPVTPPQGQPLPAKGAPPILVIGTTRDPATPYQWAKGLAAQLSSGRLLSYDGDGHTVYGGGQSACVERNVDAYLIGLALPPVGTLCH